MSQERNIKARGQVSHPRRHRMRVPNELSI